MAGLQVGHTLCCVVHIPVIFVFRAFPFPHPCGTMDSFFWTFSLHGHQIVAHWVGNDYRCQDYYNPVDGDEVPVPHTGLALTVEQFHDLADRLKKAGITFIIEPHLRFQGQPGEQWTMFFKDPSGNNLEFKAMTKPDNLFAKYNVVDK
jgi:uncharacterized protein